MIRILSFFRQNAIAIAALFIALGGTSYAAVAIPRNSVGTKQLRSGAVTASKLASGIGGEVAAVAQIGIAGNVVSSTPRKVTVVGWKSGQSGLISESGTVRFPHQFPKSCLAIASAAESVGASGGGGLADATAQMQGRSAVAIAADGPTFINLAVVCPR